MFAKEADRCERSEAVLAGKRIRVGRITGIDRLLGAVGIITVEPCISGRGSIDEGRDVERVIVIQIVAQRHARLGDQAAVERGACGSVVGPGRRKRSRESCQAASRAVRHAMALIRRPGRVTSAARTTAAIAVNSSCALRSVAPVAAS